MTLRSSATTSRRNRPNRAKTFGFFTWVAAARFGVAVPLDSEMPARAAERRAAARADPAETGPVVLTAAVSAPTGLSAASSDDRSSLASAGDPATSDAAADAPSSGADRAASSDGTASTG